MNIFKRASIQSRLEQLLTKQGELEKFKASPVFQTTVANASSQLMRIVKFHDLVTCYFITEEFGHTEDSPSVTVAIGESGKWRFLARHRKQQFSKVLKTA